MKNITTGKSKMWKSNDKRKDSRILSQKNVICEKWNGKIRDSLILSQEDWKCENQIKK